MDGIGRGPVATRRRIVATGAKLAYVTPLVAATIKLGSGGAAAVSGGDCLSSTWDEREYYGDVWHGTWTRVSGNDFAATWVNGGSTVTGHLQIAIDCGEGGHVHVVRTGSSDGNDCVYDGTYDGTTLVSGTYTCTCCGNTQFPWHATIG